MTISELQSTKESLTIGTAPFPETSGGAVGNVIYAEFSPPQVGLPNTVSVDSLLQEFEADEAMAPLLADARKDFARTFYDDEPQSFSAMRLSTGLSQARLAELAGTSQPHIAKIEQGKNDPSTDLIARIASALGVDEAQVFRAIRVQRTTRG